MPVTLIFIMTVIFIGRAEIGAPRRCRQTCHGDGNSSFPKREQYLHVCAAVAQLLMTFLHVSVPQRSPYVSNTSEFFVEMVLSHPEQEFCLSLVAREVTVLCCFVLLVHYGVFVASRPGNVSLFWNYLMGIFPVSDVVKVVLVFFGTAFPCYLSGYFCDTRGAFLCLVLRVYTEHSLCVLPQLPLRRRDFLSHVQGLITLTAIVLFCEGHSD